MSTKVLIGIVGVMVAVLVAGLVWMWRAPGQDQGIGNQPPVPADSPAPAGTLPEVNQNPVAAPLPTPVPQEPAPVVQAPPDPQELARAQAGVFAEIFGSYSTDQPYQNLRSLNGLVTQGYWNRLQGMIAAGGSPEGFYAVTSRSLASEFVEYGAEQAVVTVTLQRSERFSVIGDIRLRYEQLRVALVHQGDSWLVQSAEWVAP